MYTKNLPPFNIYTPHAHPNLHTTLLLAAHQRRPDRHHLPVVDRRFRRRRRRRGEHRGGRDDRRRPRPGAVVDLGVDGGFVARPRRRRDAVVLEAGRRLQGTGTGEGQFGVRQLRLQEERRGGFMLKCWLLRWG